MVRRSRASQLEIDREKKAAFGRRRRKLRLGFEALQRLFASDVSFAQIAEKAGVSRTRIQHIFNDHYSDLLPFSATERRRKREAERRSLALEKIHQAFLRDGAMRAIVRSAAKAGRKVEPIIFKREGDPTRCFRHRRVLVDGKEEPVHRIRNARLLRGERIAYGSTPLTREELKRHRHVIFHVDVPSHRRRVLRCPSARLLKQLFPAGVDRRDVYIPVSGRPDNPRYDFLADEDNWD